MCCFLEIGTERNDRTYFVPLSHYTWGKIDEKGPQGEMGRGKKRRGKWATWIGAKSGLTGI